MPDSISIENIFFRVLEITSFEERQKYLQKACGDDIELRRDIESLVQAHEFAGDFLNQKPSLTTRIPELFSHAIDENYPVISGFKIERKLGSGGLGAVYEAWDEKLHRKVALKILHVVPDSEMQRRVLDEARKMAAVHDPAIVGVYAVLDQHRPPAIVMELIEGFPVDHSAQNMTYEQRARILREIARALAVAHDRGIIHRDLKPGNVLLTPAMKPVILDFGLAVSIQEAAYATRLFEGTPLYASPEQIAGKALTAASDVFSFGSLMFKVLTGKTPFDGVNPNEVLEAIQKARPPFLRDVAIQVPEDLQAICLACLAADPECRPTAEEIALDLGRFLAGEPARLRPALYSDILRQRISEYSNDLLSWTNQGMISSHEKDRMQAVHRRILADEDHWLIDARWLTPVQAILYTSAWIVVVAAGVWVWMIREETSPVLRWLLPLLETTGLLGMGFLAERRKETMASAAFLAGAVISLVPTTLAILSQLKLFAVPAANTTQLFEKAFTNQQLLVACLIGLSLSLIALSRLRMTGFAWTSCALAIMSYFGFLLQRNWLGQEPQIMALWTLPLLSFSIVALVFEKTGHIRWSMPFHLITLLVLLGALDVMAIYGPTLAMVGLDQNAFPFLNEKRQEFFSFALNGALFLLLMILTAKSKSLDLRRGSRVLEVAAILHLLLPLFYNVREQRADSTVIIDMSIYGAVVLLFLVLGPLQSRWRMLVGSLSGVALGSYLVIDLDLIPKKAFVLSLGAMGLISAFAAYTYLRFLPRMKQKP